MLQHAKNLFKSFNTTCFIHGNLLKDKVGLNMYMVDVYVCACMHAYVHVCALACLCVYLSMCTYVVSLRVCNVYIIMVKYTASL